MSKLSGSQTQERKLYRGVFTVDILAVNPSVEEIEQLTEGKITLREETPAKQTQTTRDGSTTYDQERVRFVVKIPKDKNVVLEEDEYTLMDFYLKDLDISYNSGRWVATNAGQMIYVQGDNLTDEEAIQKAISGEIRNSHAKATSGCIIEGAGEKELFAFLQKAFNLNPYADDVQANYKDLFFADWAKGDTDWDALQEAIDSFNPEVKVLLYVDRKMYQKVDTRSTMKTAFSANDNKFASRLQATIEDQASNGRKVINDAAANEVIVVQEVVDVQELAKKIKELEEGISSNDDISSAADVLG